MAPPASPCSGPNRRTRRTLAAPRSALQVGTPAAVTPEALVISPTRLPATGQGLSRSRSIPARTLVIAGGDGSTARADSLRAGMVGLCTLDQRDRVGDDRQNRRGAVGCATGGSRQRDDEGLPANAHDLPREVGGREAAGGFSAHFLGEPGHLELDALAHALGGSVARGYPGAAGQDDEVRLSRVGPDPDR